MSDSDNWLREGGQKCSYCNRRATALLTFPGAPRSEARPICDECGSGPLEVVTERDALRIDDVSNRAWDNPHGPPGGFHTTCNETIAALREQLAAAEAELHNIAHANPREWDEDVCDQFAQWAKSRALHTLKRIRGEQGT